MLPTLLELQRALDMQSTLESLVEEGNYWKVNLSLYLYVCVCVCKMNWARNNCITNWMVFILLTYWKENHTQVFIANYLTTKELAKQPSLKRLHEVVVIANNWDYVVQLLHIKYSQFLIFPLKLKENIFWWKKSLYWVCLWKAKRAEERGLVSTFACWYSAGIW